MGRIKTFKKKEGNTAFYKLASRYFECPCCGLIKYYIIKEITYKDDGNLVIFKCGRCRGNITSLRIRPSVAIQKII